MIKNVLKRKLFIGFFSFLFVFAFSLYGENFDFLSVKNWVLLGENEKGEKLFYEKDSVRGQSGSKIILKLLYLPSDDITRRCEEYWMNWFLMNEYREVMWSGIPKEEKAKCKSLKYGIYTWQIDCKKRNFREMDFVWYNNKGTPVYTRKNVGISFLFVPEDLVKTLFDKFCKH